MPDLNTYSCTGRLGRDAETRTVGDSEVANFSLAVDASYKKKGGEKVERTTWIDCAVWGGLARVVQQYTSQGSRVGVSGELIQENWVDKESGGKRSKLKLNVRDFVLLDSKQDGQGGGNPNPQRQGGGTQSGPDHQPIDESDIPFAADPIGAM